MSEGFTTLDQYRNIFLTDKNLTQKYKVVSANGEDINGRLTIKLETQNLKDINDIDVIKLETNASITTTDTDVQDYLGYPYYKLSDGETTSKKLELLIRSNGETKDGFFVSFENNILTILISNYKLFNKADNESYLKDEFIDGGLDDNLFNYEFEVKLENMKLNIETTINSVEIEIKDPETTTIKFNSDNEGAVISDMIATEEEQV